MAPFFCTAKKDYIGKEAGEGMKQKFLEMIENRSSGAKTGLLRWAGAKT